MDLSVVLFSFALFSVKNIVLANSFEIEIVWLTIPSEESNKSVIPLSFKVFNKSFSLQLKPNEKLMSDSIQIWKRVENEVLVKIDFFQSNEPCLYVHQDSFISAAISLCNKDGSVHGFIFFDNESLEVSPATTANDLLKLDQNLEKKSFGKPHVVRKREASSLAPTNATAAVDENQIEKCGNSKDGKKNPSENGKKLQPLTVELAVFLDAAAYKIFNDELLPSDDQLIDLMLAYVNNMQALYHHPTLGRKIDLVLVRLELFQFQPIELSRFDGERDAVLGAFCKFSKKSNPPSDDDPAHWDIGLYLSGLDFYEIETELITPISGRKTKNHVTMGLAPVGGVCWDDYACVIAEFGVSNNETGKPYPSAGFTSLYIAAHEIAHNMGMHHDSIGNDCPKDGFIMSPSRGVNGESQWSTCSRAAAANLEEDKPCLLDVATAAAVTAAAGIINYNGSRTIVETIESRWGNETRKHLSIANKRSSWSRTPGKLWTARKQCQILLKDEEAIVDGRQEDCCKSLKCRSRKRNEAIAAGPALDGTVCAAEGRAVCRAGDCLRVQRPDGKNETKLPAGIVIGTRNNSWRKVSPCSSGCIRGSTGTYVLSRKNYSSTTDRYNYYRGIDVDVRLCDDTEICGKIMCDDSITGRKRKSAEEYASERCLDFSAKLRPRRTTNDVLQSSIVANNGAAAGLQLRHDPERSWLACALVCAKRKNRAVFDVVIAAAVNYNDEEEFLLIAPKIDRLQSLGVDTYFPDGTRCHVDTNGQNYFCKKHLCLPEKHRFYNKSSSDLELQIETLDDLETSRSSTDDMDYVELPLEYRRRSV